VGRDLARIRFFAAALAALVGVGVAGSAREVRAETEVAKVEAGVPAPDFRAPASTGGTIGLADLKGKVVVLYFYPKDDTPGCTAEAKGFRDLADDFGKAGAVVLGVSRDGLESHAKFARKHGLTFALLADPDGRIHDAFGAWKEGSIFGRSPLGVDRSTFVIDGLGVVRKAWHGVDPDGHATRVLDFVRSLEPAR